MPISHRNGDSRVCGATTTVIGQNFVNIDGELWAVVGDTETHGDGQLENTQNYVKINGSYVILLGDPAQPDDLCIPLGAPHCDPVTSSGDSLVTVN